MHKTPRYLLFRALNKYWICEETWFRSSENFCNMCGINIHHIFDTAEKTSIDVTYLQFENIHITFVSENNARIVVMERPKSSQCT